VDKPNGLTHTRLANRKAFKEKYMKRLILTVTLLLVSNAYAEYVVLGVGNNSCDKYASRYEQKETKERVTHAVEKEWIQGVITGINMAKNGFLGEKTDPEGLTLWIYNYCQENPLESLSKATENLAAELIKSGK